MGRKDWLKEVFGTSRPIIGMVHLEPLPGSPGYDPHGGIEKIVELALQDLHSLESGGVDGIQIENQWDRPFLKECDQGPETVACLSAVAALARRESRVPLGVNIHLNAVVSAIAAAVAAGCRWVRAFEIANAYVSNAGIIEAAGPRAMRYRAHLHAAGSVFVLADFHVKHGSHQLIADRSIEEQLEDVQTAGADAAIVTGSKTGVAPDPRTIQRLSGLVEIPLLIGSGLSAGTLEEMLPHVDGAIVGTNFKRDGQLRARVDEAAVSRFMTRVRKIRGE